MNAQLKSASDTERMFDACRRRNQRGIIELLLEGISVNMHDAHGQTMLMFATRNGDTSMAEFLLSQGAEVNARDAYTRSCLHHAAGSGNPAMLRLLVS